MTQSVLEKYRWLATCPVREVSVAPLDSERFSVDGKVVEKASLPAAALNSAPEDVYHLNFLTDGWKFTRLQLFNPLIFFCAFGEDSIFSALELALRSVLDIGQYQGDIAVFTNNEGVARLEQIRQRLSLRGVFSIEVLSGCEDEIDMYLSRFRFYDRSFFQSRQPLLYLDTDILCNAPVEPVLMALAFSQNIDVVPEGILNEGNDNSSGHWYGWRMMAEDGMSFDPRQRGFSAGTIAYGNSAVACEYAQLITQIAQRYREKTKQHRPFVGYDQCLANYVFLKAGVRRFDVLKDAVSLHRIRESHPDVFPHERRGFIHFLAVPFSVKLEVMQLYDQKIRRKLS